MGGEPLDSVMGQSEDVEYPKYSMGAFSGDRLPVSYVDKPHNW